MHASLVKCRGSCRGSYIINNMIFSWALFCFVILYIRLLSQNYVRDTIKLFHNKFNFSLMVWIGLIWLRIGTSGGLL
jgi:hypothetical protein